MIKSRRDFYPYDGKWKRQASTWGNFPAFNACFWIHHKKAQSVAIPINAKNLQNGFFEKLKKVNSLCSPAHARQKSIIQILVNLLRSVMEESS
jgi:hypothetical protein